jgi:hypothetical protein
MSDRETVVKAFEQAGAVIGTYLEPGPRDAAATMNKLIAVLDSQNQRRPSRGWTERMKCAICHGSYWVRAAA